MSQPSQLVRGRRRRAAACALPALAALAGGCVELDASIESTCLARLGVEVPGVPAPAEASSVGLELRLSVGELEALAALESELRLVHVRLAPVDGGDAVRGVDAASVTVAPGDPASTAPEVTAAACGAQAPDDAAPGCELRGADLVIPALPEVDVTAQVVTGTLRVGLAIAGTLPGAPWAADVEVCAYGRARGAAGL